MIINSSLCYIERDGAYLMLHRVKKKNDINHDKWLGIGGKFEDGESPYDCILREVFEETSLRLISPRYRGLVTFVADDGYTEHMHLFTCDSFSGEPGECRGDETGECRGDEIGDCPEGELEWVQIDKISSLPIWEGDKIFLDLLAANRPFFSLKLSYRGDELAGAWLDGERL